MNIGNNLITREQLIALWCIQQMDGAVYKESEHKSIYIVSLNYLFFKISKIWNIHNSKGLEENVLNFGSDKFLMTFWVIFISFYFCCFQVYSKDYNV